MRTATHFLTMNRAPQNRRASLRLVAVRIVCLGSATLSAANYAAFGLATHWIAAAGLGVIAGALDLLKPEMMRAAADQANDWPRRLMAGLIFMGLFVASMIAVDGMLLKLRAEWSGPRAQAIFAFERTEAEYKTAIAELARLAANGPTRPVAEIAAAMSGAPIALNVWRRTSHCTDVTREDSVKACAPVLALRREMARAKTKEALDAKRDAAKLRLDSLERPTAADPQAETIARLLATQGVSEAAVQYAMVAVLGLALELVACFGPWVLTPRPILPRLFPSAPEAGPAHSPRPAPTPMPNKGSTSAGRRTFRKDEALVDLITETAIGRHHNNQAFAARWAVVEGTASKWIGEWQDQGLVHRHKVGREIAVEIA